MKKNELINYTNRVAFENYHTAKRLYNCKAWYITTDSAIILQSYNTYVGIYNRFNGSLYIFNNYSATTYQHIYKFAKMVDASRIVWLYKRYDNAIETGLNWYANSYKLTNKEFNDIKSLDFSTYITNIW